MRKDIILTVLTAAGISLPAMADDQYYDRARVLAVTPQYERINHPVQSCHTEYMRESVSSGGHSPLGAIIGGVAGGLLGSQIGKGNGRVAGAAVGAGIGAVVGDRMGSTYQTRPIERCVVTDNWQTVSSGYLVSYRYNGRDYTTVLDHDPGKTMPVRVSINAGHGVSGIGYHQHAYSAPTHVVPGQPVAARPYAMNIQFHGEKGKAGSWKKGRDKHERHERDGRRYY